MYEAGRRLVRPKHSYAYRYSMVVTVSGEALIAVPGMKVSAFYEPDGNP